MSEIRGTLSQYARHVTKTWQNTRRSTKCAFCKRNITCDDYLRVVFRGIAARQDLPVLNSCTRITRHYCGDECYGADMVASENDHLLTGEELVELFARLVRLVPWLEDTAGDPVFEEKVVTAREWSGLRDETREILVARCTPESA